MKLRRAAGHEPGWGALLGRHLRTRHRHHHPTDHVDDPGRHHRQSPPPPWPVLAWGLDRAAHLHDLVDLMKVTESIVRLRLQAAHPVEKADILRRANDLGAAA